MGDIVRFPIERVRRRKERAPYETIDAKTESAGDLHAEPHHPDAFAQAVAVIDHYCKNDYPPELFPDGRVRSIIRALFDGAYRRQLLDHIHSANGILTTTFVGELYASGMMDSLQEEGRILEQCIETLRSQDTYHSSQEQKKLDMILRVAENVKKTM